MSINSPTFYASQFATDVELLAQQKQSKLQGCVTVGTGHVGKQASPCDQVGAVDPSENTERFAPMPRTDASTDRRWVMPRFWDLNQLKDKNDLIRQITDDKQALARAAVAGMNRRKDLSILDGMLNTNYTGETGTTSTAFLSTQVVGVNIGGTASGLNVAKLRDALRIHLENDLDDEEEEFYVATSGKQHSLLLAETQITSADYNAQRDGVPVLRNGKIAQFLGYNFVHCERTTAFNGTDDQGGTSTPIPTWAKSGVYLGIWADTSMRIDERVDLRAIPWQLYGSAAFGGTRLQEKKVVKIWAR